jgi:hypothetical protein
MHSTTTTSITQTRAPGFLTKLQGQLVASSVGAVQTAAELLYVHLLIPGSEVIGGTRKREIVVKTLAFHSQTAPLPDDLAAVLDSVLFVPGERSTTIGGGSSPT